MTKQEQMQAIARSINICRKCRLCERAQNSVPGEGNINSEIVFIGEAPGATEDATGRPFVGRAGQLLEASLKLVGLSRSDVWIGNIIKHRPPDNRDPLPDEIAACQPFLTAQLEIISPKLIVTLGRFSFNFFYPDGKISRDRGKLIKVNNYSIFPVYHPAAALRNPDMKVAFISDIKNLPEILKSVKNNQPAVLASDDGQLALF